MAVSGGFLEVRLLRIPGAHARVELPDGLQLLLPAGIRRRQSRLPGLCELSPTRSTNSTGSAHNARGRSFRVGTGELADSLAFDSIYRDQPRPGRIFRRAAKICTLELKTKTDEIENLLSIDPRGRMLVSWTLSPDAVYRSSEHRTASPSARIAAARAVLDAGYRVAFHLDPMIAYPEAERDYLRLIDELLDIIPPETDFVHQHGRAPDDAAVARRRARPFPRRSDAMRRGRARRPTAVFGPSRRCGLSLYRALAERFRKAGAEIPAYLCMEPASVHEHVFGACPRDRLQSAQRLARG